MNQLCQKFQDKLAVLAFPSNQFGHQENNSNEELLDLLRHVRPGKSFQPLMDIFEKVRILQNEFEFNSFYLDSS